MKRAKPSKTAALFAARKPEGPLLSLAMMVKDEEDFLEDALKSAKSFCDELVVVDTGSTDRTVEIAKDLGAKVSHFAWCDDFSKARNETLRRATGRYIAVLDADERFKGNAAQGLRRFLSEPQAGHPFVGVALNVMNVQLDGTPMTSFFSTRIFPNDPRLGYSGRVHNRFGSLDPEHPLIASTRFLGLEIVHLGYDPRVYASRKKAERSLPLIEATVREEPSNHQYRYYLGREYLLLGRAKDAIAVLEPTFQVLKDQPTAGPLVDVATTLMAALADQDPARTQAIAQATLVHEPHHADLWFALAKAQVVQEQNEAAVTSLKQALASLSHLSSSQCRLTHQPEEAQALLGQLCFGMGRHQEAYQALLAAVPKRAPEAAGQAYALNSAVALAIELGDTARLPDLLGRLLDHPQAPLGMFFFEVEKRLSQQSPEAARTLLAWGVNRCPRLVYDAEYARVAGRLSFDARRR